MDSTKGIRPRRAGDMGRPSGGRREGPVEPAALEMLEPRMLLDAGDPTALDGDVLQVHGTTGADVITIEAGEADDTGHRDVSVTINGVTEQFSDVIASVEVRGYAKADDIRMTGDLKMVAHGGFGDDYIRGGTGRDELHGNEGDDIIDGGDEYAALKLLKPASATPPPPAAPDQATPEQSPQEAPITVGPSAGGDWIYGGDGNDVIDGGAGHDRLFGGDGDDLIEGGAGKDTIYGGGGADVIYGNSGDDTIHGGKRQPGRLFEDKGDTIYGGSGNDVLSGGYGNDRLVGGAGDDELDGGVGMDALFAHEGTDTIDGGWGSDRIYFSSLSVIADFDGDDTEDAAFALGSDGGTWTQGELDRLDDAVKLMHEANGTNATIQRPGGAYVTFTRCGDNGDIYATNLGGGLIEIYDGAVELDDAGKDWFGRTIVHMLGNNWDTENPDWEEFLELSGWTQVNHDGEDGWSYTNKYLQEWWYETDSEFARSYGREHPMDDWGTCIEAYFYGDNWDGTVDEDHSWMQENMPEKFAFVDDFLTNFEG